MTLHENQIVHEMGHYWVLDTKKSYAVMRNQGTHSLIDSEYPHTQDGLSIAIARCTYLAKSLWDHPTPHFHGFAPHRYEGNAQECKYCGRPKDWKGS